MLDTMNVTMIIVVTMEFKFRAMDERAQSKIRSFAERKKFSTFCANRKTVSKQTCLGWPFDGWRVWKKRIKIHWKAKTKTWQTSSNL